MSAGFGPGLDGAEVAFNVAPGEPGLLMSASARFGTIGEGLLMHGTTLRSTALSLRGAWDGVSAAAYQDLTAVTAAHFDAAADMSRIVSSTLSCYSSELDRCQLAGRVATGEALRCLGEIRAQNAKLQAARQAAAFAEEGLSSARSQARAARAMGPVGIAAAAVADVEAAASATALAVAQADERAAWGALSTAQDELEAWRARGRRAWDEAQAAAERATRQIESTTIVPPPLAGMPGFAPLTVTPPFTPAGPLVNPGGPALAGGLGFTASPLTRSQILYGREQPKQLSPEEEAAVRAKEAGERYDDAVFRGARNKLNHNEKVAARTRNRQKRQNGQRQPPKGGK